MDENNTPHTSATTSAGTSTSTAPSKRPFEDIASGGMNESPEAGSSHAGNGDGGNKRARSERRDMAPDSQGMELVSSRGGYRMEAMR